MDSITQAEVGSASRDGGGLGRLRRSAAKIVAVGVVVAGGGVATMVTGFANTGSVAVSEDCTSWTAAASLDNNVSPDHRIIVDAFGATVFDQTGIDTTHRSGATVIWHDSGAAPKSGDVTLTIKYANGSIEQTYTKTLTPATGCKLQPALSTTPSAGGQLGTVLHDTALLSGGRNLTGAVSFALFAPSDASCSATPVFTSSGVIAADRARSGTYTSTAVGTYHWVASYPGDANNKAATSPCTGPGSEPVVIGKAGPAISTTPSAGGRVGTAISDSATVSGRVNPSSAGTVTFTLYGAGDLRCAAAPLATRSVALAAASNTVSSPSFTTLVEGTYSWTATYSGDASNAGATSACGVETALITPAASTVLPQPPSLPNTAGPAAVQGIATPSTGSSAALSTLTLGVFLALAGLGLASLGLLPQRRNRI